MAVTAANAVEYVMWLTWSCLTLTPANLKNPVFAMIFSTEDVLEQLMSDSLLVFAPGLLDVLQATTPPSVPYFKSLPADIKKHWAIYLLVLEKPGCRHKIYIGSGTDRDRGGAKRFWQYDTKRSLPRYVERALNDGYTIVHKGLLCWSPNPTTAKRVAVRALFLAIEATISIVLWAMVSRTKDYGMPHLCPWSLETMEYDGCCSHTALAEHIAGEADGLSLEQIAAKEVEKEQRRIEQRSATYYDFKRLDFKGWQATRRRYAQNIDPVKRAAIAKKHKANMKTTRKYACDICDVVFTNSNDLNVHKTTRKHIDKATGTNRVVKAPKYATWAAANTAARRYYCEICDRAFSTQTKPGIHNATQKHINKTAAIESTKSSS
jgi:hypothetical protein